MAGKVSLQPLYDFCDNNIKLPTRAHGILPSGKDYKKSYGPENVNDLRTKFNALSKNKNDTVPTAWCLAAAYATLRCLLAHGPSGDKMDKWNDALTYVWVFARRAMGEQFETSPEFKLDKDNENRDCERDLSAPKKNFFRTPYNDQILLIEFPVAWQLFTNYQSINEVGRQYFGISEKDIVNRDYDGTHMQYKSALGAIAAYLALDMAEKGKHVNASKALASVAALFLRAKGFSDVEIDAIGFLNRMFDSVTPTNHGFELILPS